LRFLPWSGPRGSDHGKIQIAMASFSSIIEKFDSNLWGFHFVVPGAIAQPFIDGTNRRVVCRLNDTVEFQCALMPKGDGQYFINVNKKLRDRLRLKVGTTVEVALKKDESEYGLPMPEELAELFKLDDEGSVLFHALTPGRQRTLLYWIGTPKSSDGRITRALAMVDHLKANRGKVNYRTLMGPR
jgi:hypothetical protein